MKSDIDRFCSKCAEDNKLRTFFPCYVHDSGGAGVYRSTDANDFLYDEQLSGRTIRLVHIGNGSGDDEIRIALKTISFDGPSAQLTYKALSYVWGNSPNKRTIYCNDSLLEVGENLYDALWQIREDGETDIPWWVDAISINQADVPEKTEQVQMMTDIYSRAYLVRAWLGQATEQDEAGFGLLRMIYSLLGHHQRNSTRWLIEGLTEPIRNDALVDLNLPPQDNSQWKALVGIINRPYFYRSWIVQEMIIAQRCIVSCGRHSVDRDTVLGVGALMQIFSKINLAMLAQLELEGFPQLLTLAEPLDIGILQERMATLPVPTIQTTSVRHFSIRYLWSFSTNRTKDGGWRHGYSLTNLLRNTMQFRASDERDKIFAMIGLSSDISKDIIDYSKELDTIHLEVARTLIERPVSWGPMLFTFVNPAGRSENLPSWVPDWTCAPVLSTSLSSYRFLEPGYPGIAGSVWWTIDSSNVLRIRGRIFDSVQDVIHRRPYDTPTPHMNDTAINVRAAMEIDLWSRECFDLMEKNLEYKTGESNFEAFWRTLVCNREKGYTAAPKQLGECFICWIIQWQILVYLFKERVSSREGTGEDDEMWVQLKVALSMYLLTWVHNFGPRFEAAFNQYAPGRKFFRSGRRWIGWVPTVAQEGDLLCLFEHYWMPFIVRRTQGGYRLIGEAYVHGIMDEEPEELRNCPYEDISLV